MRIFQSLALAVMLVLGAAGYTSAQDAKCLSVEQFSAEVHKQDPKFDLMILTGDQLEAFAQNMDKISGGGHGPIDGIAFLNPEGNDNQITTLTIFRDGCYIGNVDVPTEWVKEALGQGV